MEENKFKFPTEIVDLPSKGLIYPEGSSLSKGKIEMKYMTAKDEDIFIVSFLRMGGESRPWGVAYGTIADGPTVLTVPEGRNRQLVGDMMATFAAAILSHFRHPSFSEGPAAYSTLPLRQLWLPGTSHLETSKKIFFCGCCRAFTLN